MSLLQRGVYNKMKNLKFRGYHQGLKQFYYGSDIFTIKELFGRISADPDAYEINQWTGLLDKVGKEIYEGDVIKWMGGCIEKVEWLQEIGGYNIGESEAFKVIGNIYENPTLLKGENHD